MHPNPGFHTASTDQNLSFARDRGFGVLTIGGSGGPDGPLASHIPFVLSGDGSGFGAHLVRSNPVARFLEDKECPALLIISGSDGYISPDWYDLGDQVPTWNYVAVHLRGVLRRLPDDRLRPHLAALSAQFERRLAPKPVWTMDKVAPEALARLERMIVPVAFTIESVDGTWKLSQNKPAAARIGAADALAQSDLGMMAAELTDLMRAAEAGEG